MRLANKRVNFDRGGRMEFNVREELAEYDSALRVAWPDGGTWPHSNHYGFNEAVVAAHFALRGYEVLRHFRVAHTATGDPVVDHTTALMHAVVGPEVSDFFASTLDEITNHGSGQPDLFIFRAPDNPNDPKIRFGDPRLWFFVEVKGPGDKVQSYQRTFWRAVAEQEDLGLGPDRIRLFRTAPTGTAPELKILGY